MTAPPVTGNDGLLLGLDHFSLRPPGSAIFPQTPYLVSSRVSRRNEGAVDLNMGNDNNPEDGHALFHIDGQLRDTASLLPTSLLPPPPHVPEGMLDKPHHLRVENQCLKAKSAVQVPSGSSVRRRRDKRGKTREDPPLTQATTATKRQAILDRLGPLCRIDPEGRVHLVPIEADRRPQDDDHGDKTSMQARSATASTACSNERRREDRRREEHTRRVQCEVQQKPALPEHTRSSGTRSDVSNVPDLGPEEEFEVSQGGRTLHVVNNRTRRKGSGRTTQVSTWPM